MRNRYRDIATGRAVPRLVCLLVLSLVMAAAPVQAQDADDPPPPPPPPAADTVQLVFDREVFTYPAHQRRNPFRPLTGPGDAGPRFEELTLMAVIVSAVPGGSLAVFHVPGPPADGGGTHRLREGQVLGNVRVLAIRFREVDVEVEEFGLRERVTMRLDRSSPTVSAGDDADRDDADGSGDGGDGSGGGTDGSGDGTSGSNGGTSGSGGGVDGSGDGTDRSGDGAMDEPGVGEKSPPSQGVTTNPSPDSTAVTGEASGDNVGTGGSGVGSGQPAGTNGNGGNR